MTNTPVTSVRRPPAPSGQPPACRQDRRDEIVAAMSRLPVEHRRRLRVVVVVVLSFGVVGYALVTYGGFDPGAAKVGLRPGVPWHFSLLMAHILGGSIALSLGPLQFVRRIRGHRRLHRYIGRAYLLAGVLPASVAGLGVAVLTTAGPVAAAGLVVGDLLWFGTALAGYLAARGRRYRDHARWMLRNFALTFAAVSFRGWLGLLIVVQLPLLPRGYHGDFGALFHTAYLTTTWLAFIPNVLVVNWYLRRARRPVAARR